MVPAFEEQFAKAQTNRADAWDQLRGTLETGMTKTREDMTAELHATTEQLTADASATRDEISEKADELIKEVTARRDEVERLYRVIADTGTAGAFAEDAKTQQGIADTWRRYTVRCGVATALLAVGSVIFTALTHHTTDVAHAGSLLVAIVVGGLTAYCARQSGHHRDRELESKRLEMELTSIGPFTDALTDRDRCVRISLSGCSRERSMCTPMSRRSARTR
jgi:hypothetical protein